MAISGTHACICSKIQPFTTHALLLESSYRRIHFIGSIELLATLLEKVDVCKTAKRDFYNHSNRCYLLAEQEWKKLDFIFHLFQRVRRYILTEMAGRA